MIVTDANRYRVRVADSETELNSPVCISNAYTTGDYKLAIHSAIEDVHDCSENGIALVEEWDSGSDSYKKLKKLYKNP